MTRETCSSNDLSTESIPTLPNSRTSKASWKGLGIHTRMSSLPNWPLMKSASRVALEGSVTSSWWKKTSAAALELLMASTASTPLAVFLAVRTTLSPLVASCRHVSSPTPLFPPVTSAILDAPSTGEPTISRNQRGKKKGKTSPHQLAETQGTRGR